MIRVRQVRTAIVSACLSAALGCSSEVIDAESVSVVDQALYPASTQLWREGPIQACWENPSASDVAARGWVADAVRITWERQSNARFVGWAQCTSGQRGIRVRIADEAAPPHTTGLGTVLDGKANGLTLNFTFANWATAACATNRESCIRKIAVHEFGHVLGFAHEQNRPDTPECDEAPTGNYGDLLFGPWDLSSVMNYCNPVFNNNGALSVTDTAGVRALYGTLKLENFGYDNGSWHSDKHLRAIADVNDDGRDDIIGFGDRGVWVSTSNGAGFDAARLFFSDFGYEQGWRVDQHVRVVSDVNGDGRADIVASGNDGTFVSLSGSDRFYPWTFVNDFGSNFGWRVDKHVRALADVNGDGRADLVGFGEYGVYVALGQGASFATAQMWVADFGYASGWRVDKHIRTLADVNDDGRADIIGFGEYGVLVSLSTGTGFSTPEWFTSEFGYDSGFRIDKHPRVLADVNADGRADIVAFGENGVSVALSGSVRFYPSQLAVQAFHYAAGWRVDANPRLLADVTGDGRPDIIGYANNGVYVSTALGGQSFGPATQWAIRYGSLDAVANNGSMIPWRDFLRTAGDWDGDGVVGLIGFGPRGVHTTDLKLHLVPQPASPRIDPGKNIDVPERPTRVLEVSDVADGGIERVKAAAAMR
jgi:hypothetical protein